MIPTINASQPLDHINTVPSFLIYKAYTGTRQQLFLRSDFIRRIEIDLGSAVTDLSTQFCNQWKNRFFLEI